MKKLRKISLDSLDRLSDSEASLLFGGNGPTMSPTPNATTTTLFIPTSTTKAFSGSIGSGGVSGGYNGGNWGVSGNIGKGSFGVSGVVKF